jgi:hypothetical protein
MDIRKKGGEGVEIMRGVWILTVRRGAVCFWAAYPNGRVGGITRGKP